MDLAAIHTELTGLRASSVAVAERLARLEAQIGRIERVDVDVDRALTAITALEARMQTADLRDSEIVGHLTTAKEALVRVERRLDVHSSAPPNPGDGLAKLATWFLDTRAGVAILVLLLGSFGFIKSEVGTAELARQVSALTEVVQSEIKKDESDGGVMPDKRVPVPN
jgi:hypothetical protein